jgi:hypothetical protein
MDGNSGSQTYGILAPGSYYYWRFENIYIHDMASYGYYGTNTNIMGFVNVKIDNCGWGIYGNDGFTLSDCEIYNCSNRGIQVDQSTVLMNSRFIDNGGTSHNAYLRDGYEVVTNCVFSSDQGTCLYVNYLGHIYNNVFDGQSTVNGFRLAGALYSPSMKNNIFYNCVYAIEDASGNYYHASMQHHNNMFYGSTSGNYSGTEYPAYLKDSDITGTDPGFTNAGSYDYSITSSSGAFEAGYPAYMHCGAHHPECTGGSPATPRVILTT